MKMTKLTKMLPTNEEIQTNAGFITYGEWCRNEVVRIGKRALYVEEMRESIIEDELVRKMWCRVDVAPSFL